MTRDILAAKRHASDHAMEIPAARYSLEQHADPLDNLLNGSPDPS